MVASSPPKPFTATPIRKTTRPAAAAGVPARPPVPATFPWGVVHVTPSTLLTTLATWPHVLAFTAGIIQGMVGTSQQRKSATVASTAVIQRTAEAAWHLVLALNRGAWLPTHSALSTSPQPTAYLDQLNCACYWGLAAKQHPCGRLLHCLLKGSWPEGPGTLRQAG